jgi:hypothetical protein
MVQRQNQQLYKETDRKTRKQLDEGKSLKQSEPTNLKKERKKKQAKQK